MPPNFYTTFISIIFSDNSGYKSLSFSPIQLLLKSSEIVFKLPPRAIPGNKYYRNNSV